MRYLITMAVDVEEVRVRKVKVTERHTYASTLIMAGVPLAVVAEQLGYKGTRMVDKHYGHLAKKYVTDTIRQLSPKLNLLAVVVS